MTTHSPCIHPSLQRYLPGHLPKRHRLLCTGKTNLKAYDAQHTALVQSEVTPQLTLPSRLAKSIVPSLTVSRAIEFHHQVDELARNDGANKDLHGNNIVAGNEPNNKIKGATTWEKSDSLTLKSLLDSNKTGKDHGFTRDKFYFGSETIGGSGQLEHNDPGDAYGRNSVVSAWRTRQHFSPSVRLTMAVQHPPAAAAQILSHTNADAKEGLKRRNSGCRMHSFCTVPLTAGTVATNAEAPAPPSSFPQRLPSHTNTRLATPVTPSSTYTYRPPDCYNVPPPKLRHELNDYHSTFHHTQAHPDSYMYISEHDRFHTLPQQRQVTHTNTTYHKFTRRRYIDR